MTELVGQELVDNIKKTVEFFKQKGIDTTKIFPVLRATDGEIIDGNHRVQANSKWTEIREDIPPDLRPLLRLAFNYGRRRMPPEELTEELEQVAKITGWNAREASMTLGIPYTTVLRHYPQEYKRAYQLPEKEEVEPEGEKKLEVNEKDTLYEFNAPDKEIVIPQGVFTDYESKEREKTPEETAETVVKQFDGEVSHAFVESAVIREHNLNPNEAEEIVNKVMPTERKTWNQGVRCPVCGCYRPESILKAKLSALDISNEVISNWVRRQLEWEEEYLGEP